MRALRAYRHVVWDFNGTLFQDLSLSLELLNKELARRGVPPVTTESYRQKFCHPVIDFYARIGLPMDQEEYGISSRNFHMDYMQRFAECSLYPGVMDAVTSVSDAGLTQSILSALPHDVLEPVLERLGIGSHFNSVRGGNDYNAHSKVEAARLWLEQSGFGASEVLFIGDTTHDAEVARALSCDCVLIPQGYQAREIVEKEGFPVIDSLEELRKEFARDLPSASR